MAVIQATIQNRIVYIPDDVELVCNNPTDVIQIEFDEEWNGKTGIMARFVWNGKPYEVPVIENKVQVPEITKAAWVNFGVYADNITTTPAKIKCKESILCYGGSIRNPPANPFYDEFCERLENVEEAVKHIGVDATPLIAYISRLGDGRYMVDKDFAELYNAAIAGRSVELIDADTYNIHGALRYTLTSVDYGVMQFERRIAHVSYVCTLTDTDGRYVRRSTVELVSPQDRLSNPNSLKFAGSTNAEYDGSTEVYVNVADNWQDLKGKPFGVIGKDGYVFTPTDLPIGANGLSEFPIAFGIEAGLEYVVTIDGIDYAATAKELPYGGQPAVMLGNTSFLQIGEDNGLPFLLGTVIGQRMSAIGYPAKAGGVVHLAISGVPKLVRIPAEYLPESLGAVDKTNAGKLLYVDENGVLQPVTLGNGLSFINGVLSIT